MLRISCKIKTNKKMKDFRTLDMLQSFVRKEVSPNDLGYLTRWLMVDYQNISLIEYISKINEFLEIDFFDTPNKIKFIVDWYQNSIEQDLNALENQTYEG